MVMPLFKAILIAIMLTGVLASFVVGALRIGWEENYKTVEIILKLNGTPPQILDKVTAVGIDLDELSPQTLKQLDLDFDLDLDLVLVTSLPFDEELCERYLRELVEFEPDEIIFKEGKCSRDALSVLEGIRVGFLEFSIPPLIKEFYRTGFRNFVRVHTIKPQEMANLSEKEALDRLIRAVKERNIRSLYLQFVDLSFITKLNSRLRQAGFEIGEPKQPRFQLNGWLPFMVMAGAWSFVVLFLSKLTQRVLLLSLLWFGGIVVFIFFSSEVIRQALALLVAVLIPPAISLLKLKGKGFKEGVLTLGLFSALALIGGVVVGAILSEDQFFLGIELFRGVKVSLILPLLMVIILHEKDLRFLGRKGILIFLGAILAILVLRSGNWGVPILEVEEGIRTLLENLFYARPRFKEFLIGHPLLFLWGVGAAHKRYSVILLAGGMIGQVSIINTFVHLHTPLTISLLRTANGVALGLLLGLLLGVLTWLIRWLWKLRS
jgi:hypothetical protein